ncbi:MAG: glycosyltransferase family 4 protein [Sulfurimonadaceae bacterium]
MTVSPTAVICLSPYQGGMEIDSIKLAFKLSGVTDVTLIAQQGKFIEEQYHQHPDSKQINFESVAFRKSLSPSIIFGVRRIIQERGIKNVLFLGASELKSLYFSFLGLDINLIIRHGTTKSSPKKDWFHRLIYSKVNYHIAICEHLARNIEYIIPFGENTQLKVIYPSLNLAPSQSIDFDAKPHQPLQLLHVGRIAEGKGQKSAIEACKVLYDNQIDFVFTLVGGFHEPYKEGFLEFLNALEYKEKIHLAGHTNNVEQFYLNSDVFLFPSDGEGLSNAFIEALAYGLSCISYDNTSFPELQNLGFAFTLVKDQQSGQLQDALLQNAKEFASRTELQKNSSAVQAFFTPENELDNLTSLLKS